jgi:hypothetical protein
VDPGSVKSDEDPADSSSDESSGSALDTPRPATDDGLETIAVTDENLELRHAANVPDVAVDVPVTSEAKADHDSQPNTEPDSVPADSPMAASQIHNTTEILALSEASESRSDVAAELDPSTPTPHIHNTAWTSGLGGASESQLDVVVEFPTRTQRVRKMRVINLKGCECGREVSESEIKAGDLVLRCKVQGCETVWVSPVQFYYLERLFIDELVVPS